MPVEGSVLGAPCSGKLISLRSDPDSENYGKHWTPDEVARAFMPSNESIDAVRDWLVSQGISKDRISHSANRAWIAFDAKSSEVERLLKTKYHDYRDVLSGARVPACKEYSVPAHIRENIDFITPGIQLLAADDHKNSGVEKRGVHAINTNGVQIKAAPAPAMSTDPESLSSCDVSITPACIRALYSIPKNCTAPHKDNSLGIFESQNQYYWQPDLDSFYSQYARNIPNGTHPIPVSIDGGYAGSAPNASEAGGEANLDFQLAYPIVYPQTVTLFANDDYYYGQLPNDTYKFGYNTFLDAIDGSYCNYSAYGETGDASIDPHYPDPRPGGYKGQRQCGDVKSTNVVSFSYGGQEAFLPVSYQKRQCNEVSG